MSKLQSGKNRVGRVHDFVVEYKILNESQGGRKTLPSQGIKWDFAYVNEKHKPNDLFMIWPQFLDKNGQVIPKSNDPVPPSGKARMWIVDDGMRKYHVDKIYVGMKANGMEGSRPVADYVVTEIGGLISNPIR